MAEAPPAARNTLDSARIPRASILMICGLFQKGRVLAQDGGRRHGNARDARDVGFTARPLAFLFLSTCRELQGQRRKTAIHRARPHNSEGARGWVATVEEGRRVPSAGPCGRCLLPVHVDPQGSPLSAQSCFAADCGPLLSVTCSVDVSAWQARIVHRRRAPGLCVETPAHQCQSVPLRPEREYVGQHGGEPRNMTP